MAGFDNIEFGIGLGDVDKTFANIHHVHGKIITEITTAKTNFESIPPNATIRLEYIRCGKKNCHICSKKQYHDYDHYSGHGPYYMAYWRDKNNHGKLKKKYIGSVDPRDTYVQEILKRIENRT